MSCQSQIYPHAWLRNTLTIILFTYLYPTQVNTNARKWFNTCLYPGLGWDDSLILCITDLTGKVWHWCVYTSGWQLSELREKKCPIALFWQLGSPGSHGEGQTSTNSENNSSVLEMTITSWSCFKSFVSLVSVIHCVSLISVQATC